MASGKKRRKERNQASKLQRPQSGPFRHRDGDRRHRDVMAKAIQDAKATKNALQQIGAVELPDEDEFDEFDEFDEEHKDESR